MRVIIFILIFCLVLAAGLVLFRNTIVKWVVARAAQELTGFSVKIETLHLGLKDHVVDAGGMVVSNPEGFEDKLFLDVPSFVVRYDLGKILKGEYDFPDFSLYIREFQVVRRADGTSNVGRMTDRIMALRPKTGGPAKLPPIKIKTLHLKVDKVVLKDYTFRPPAIKIFDVKLEKKFENIDDPRQLIQLILVQSLSKSGIKDLMDVDLNTLKENVGSILKTETNTVFKSLDESTSGAVSGALGVFKGFLGTNQTQTNTTAP